MRKDAGSAIYQLVRRGQAETQRDIEAETGLSRGTATQRISELIAAGLLIEGPTRASGGGRPARGFLVNPHYRNVVGVDLGESQGRACLFDLSGAKLDQQVFALDLRADPGVTLDRVEDAVAMLDVSAMRSAPIAAVGLSVPAPLDVASGRVAMPSVMYGWENLDIRQALGARIGLPVAVDNDVNLLCLAEQRLNWPNCRNFAFIKIGTGIGCGIMVGGRLMRGASGTAGDLGHIQHGLQPAPLCRCGKEGCTEAHAAGWALARDLRGLGFDCQDARDVMALWLRGEPEALAALNRGSRVLGKVAADLVAMVNPQVLVIGGQLARAGEAMLAGVRELIYQRCLPLATQQLVIALAAETDDLGVLGAACLAMDEIEV
ncbi:ROK family transcriptional regulator [Paracoccus laeviglucosivorans]|uniref:Glucokinase n=1 Tax=Paracoccus laeviglucosivorans TaxID=1197861 RepID=A0A521F002_9RHOB|nr:ROK family transcriptional regulator [Paracoccus laeviglucosivorans]SMO89582.1 glucokinase [Paracoccus laeviglucosivorans]